MGHIFGRPPTPPQHPLTEKPWRTSPRIWDKQAEKEIIDKINSQKTTLTPNLLTVGPVGAGKSSFITAILSIGRDERYGGAKSGHNPSSFTLKLQRHTKHTVLHGFNLFDCMGIEANQGLGIQLKDIELLLKGHVQNRYEFNPKSSIDTKHAKYKHNPTIEDRIHCVVFVLNACSLMNVPQATIDKIKQLQETIQQEDIPRVVVLAKCDLLCNEVKKDTTNIFSSVLVEKAVNIASEMFYIEKASIHPVVNYEGDSFIRPEINIPLLYAVKQMRQYAIDQLELISD